MPDPTDGRDSRLHAPAREELAESLRAAVSGRLGESRFGLWFGDGVQLKVLEDRLEVGVPNAFFRDWIRNHFSDSLIAAGEEVTGRVLDLSFRVNNEAAPNLGKVVEVPQPGPDPRAPAPVVIPTHPQKPNAPKGQASDAPLIGTAAHYAPPTRPLRRLDEFVVGPSNRLAHAAAVELAQQRGTTFNPLLIHGAVGLGKTHLLEGIAHAWRGQRSGLRVLHATAESFTNGFLDALRAGTLPAFRSRYRGSDALILDDVHFMAAKKATQDEFLHTFNALQAKGAPVVLASDQHPRQLTRLTEELVTRFLGGMVVKIEPPDLSTRKRILESKAIARGIDIPESVLSYISEHLRSSVRELEGALHSVVAHAVLTGRRLDLGLARVALRDTIRHTSRTVGMKDVERVVCDLFSIDAEQLKSDSRARTFSYPRMLAMYLARKYVGVPYSEIGRYFGGRNHSTVISAEKKVAEWLRDEERIHRLDGFESTSEILASLELVLAN